MIICKYVFSNFFKTFRMFRLTSLSCLRALGKVENFHKLKQNIFCCHHVSSAYSPIPNKCSGDKIFNSEYLQPKFVYCLPQRTFSTEKSDKDPDDNPGVVKRFKQMFKDYWYVLIPVHVATSVVW